VAEGKMAIRDLADGAKQSKSKQPWSLLFLEVLSGGGKTFKSPFCWNADMLTSTYALFGILHTPLFEFSEMRRIDIRDTNSCF